LSAIARATSVQQQFRCATAPEQLREKPAQAHLAARDTDAHVRHGKVSRSRRDPHIAGSRERESPTHGRAVDGRDHRHRKLVQAHAHVSQSLLPAVQIGRGPSRETNRDLQVRSGAEAAAGTGQHDGANVVVGLDTIERGVHALDEGIVDRVQSIGSVERDPGEILAEIVDQYS
jgi:hypothetical protein